MAKPSKLEFATKVDNTSGATGKFTAAEANELFTAVDAIIDDYASISVGVDADTLEGSTKAEVQTHAPASHGNEVHDDTFITAADLPATYAPSSHGNDAHSSTFITESEVHGDSKHSESYLKTGDSLSNVGDVQLYNTLQGDIPLGWHICDGTNGTEDLSASNPTVNTVYIQYLGGGYNSMTARTINVDDSELAENVTFSLEEPVNEETITAVEDGAPFNLVIENASGSEVEASVRCLRDSDSYTLFKFNLQNINNASDAAIVLTQYVDCTWWVKAEVVV